VNDLIMTKTKTPTTVAAAGQTPAERLHTLRLLLRYKIESSHECIDALVKDLTNPDRLPIQALAWSARAFEAAAVLQVAQGISTRLDAGESIVDIYLKIQREALHGARGGSSSTSPTSNFAAACSTAALAEFEEFLRYDALKAKTEVES
jgi:hypothetical protein